MTTALVDRPGRWSLPPEPPETWVGGRKTLVLLTAAAASLATPTLVLLPDGRSDVVTLAGVQAAGGLLSVAMVYLLLVQASVTQDRRLTWMAGGYGALWAVWLARPTSHIIPGLSGSRDDLRLAVALSVVASIALPVVSLSAGLRHRTLWLLVLPLLLLCGLAGGLTRADTATSTGSLTGLGRTAFVLAAAVATSGALWWWLRTARGLTGPSTCVVAALALTPGIGVLHAVQGPSRAASWVTLAAEVALLALPAFAMWVLTARGFHRQARCWRRLETEVRAMRVSSALLPGLSITPQDDAGLPERPDVEELLAKAEMQVAHQQVQELSTGVVVGQEALARFGGRVPTDRWFRAAGLHGLGVDLERVTLAKALSTLAGLPPQQFLAINTSPGSLHDPEVLRLLQDADLSRIVVEITEHDAVNDYGVTRQALASLRAAGARIAVDDVGAGFASLRHVLLLQPDVVKLDTSLTRDVHNSARQRAIVASLVRFADEVGAVVLAEGIEVAEQVAPLVESGVTLGQGWHLGVPALVE